MAKKVKVEEGSQMDLEKGIEISEGKVDLKVVKKKATKKAKKAVKNVMEEFKDDEQVKQLIREMREKRQAKIEATLEEKLTPEDWEKFKTFKELHELLFAKGRIEIKERGTHYDNAEFGVQVYGEEYWFAEKDIENY